MINTVYTPSYCTSYIVRCTIHNMTHNTRRSKISHSNQYATININDVGTITTHQYVSVESSNSLTVCDLAITNNSPVITQQSIYNIFKDVYRLADSPSQLFRNAVVPLRLYGVGCEETSERERGAGYKGASVSYPEKDGSVPVSETISLQVGPKNITIKSNKPETT